ncbi:MAG: HesB/IscA family protein [bacterium]
MVAFTLKAKEKIKQMIETEGENNYLRIYAIPSGCCGIDFGMEITNEIDSSDTFIDLEDFKVVIDDFSIPFVENLEIDIIEKEGNVYFVLNTKEKLHQNGCGCGCGCGCETEEKTKSKCSCDNENCNCN